MILRKAMRPFCCLAMLALPLIFTACGLRDDNLESASGGKDNQVRKESGEISGEQGESGFPGGGKGTGEAGNASAPGGKLAAADFYYMPMNSPC
ncbi:MAG TPA: hypothetical protein DCZ91_11630 [Lachnospiraceae bacterium]|nr:hypothetical protein [Lachnospiraceae bacterium]